MNSGSPAWVGRDKKFCRRARESLSVAQGMRNSLMTFSFLKTLSQSKTLSFHAL
jgi:hypothetical protein